MSEEQVWVWRRWQLVRVEEEGDGLLVDAIDLSVGSVDDPNALITLAVCPADEPRPPEDDLGLRLQRWAVSGDGLCDAFFQMSEPNHIAILQGSELLVVAAASRS